MCVQSLVCIFTGVYVYVRVTVHSLVCVCLFVYARV